MAFTGNDKREYQRKYMNKRNYKGNEYSIANNNKQHRLSWYRWEYRDAYEPKYYTAYTVSVYAPNYNHPYPSVLISQANAGGRLLQRFPDLEIAQQYITIPQDALDRLQDALVTANEIADKIEEDMRLLMQKRHLPAGSKLVNSITGEIVAEAEYILKGG